MTILEHECQPFRRRLICISKCSSLVTICLQQWKKNHDWMRASKPTTDSDFLVANNPERGTCGTRRCIVKCDAPPSTCNGYRNCHLANLRLKRTVAVPPAGNECRNLRPHGLNTIDDVDFHSRPDKFHTNVRGRLLRGPGQPQILLDDRGSVCPSSTTIKLHCRLPRNRNSEGPQEFVRRIACTCPSSTESRFRHCSF